MPSGLNCDTGALDALAVSADLTVTFAGQNEVIFNFWRGGLWRIGGC
ncbi:MAG: hypothetical protein R3E31_18795 [Chloroflexota bacterium]